MGKFGIVVICLVVLLAGVAGVASANTFTNTPTNYFVSWAEDGTNITVPIASLTGLTAADADGTTGDIREITYAFLGRWYTVENALTSTNKSAKATITRNSTVNPVDSTIQYTYSIKFTLDLSPGSISDE